MNNDNNLANNNSLENGGSSPFPTATPVSNIANQLNSEISSSSTESQQETQGVISSGSNDDISNLNSNETILQPNLNEPQNNSINDTPTYPTPPGSSPSDNPLNNITPSQMPSQPATNDPKPKNKAKVAILVVAVLAVVGVLGYFVVYPFVQKKFLSNPKNVFETSIKNAAKNMNNIVDSYSYKNALLDLNVKFDSNINDLADFAGYKYGLKVGYNIDAKELKAGLYMEDKSNKNYSADVYLKDNKDYLKFHTNDNPIFMGEEDSAEINQMFSEIEQTMTELPAEEDVSYLITKVSDLLVESIDEEKLTKEEATIKVNGTKVEATKNTYEMDSKLIEDTYNKVIDGLIKDKKTSKTLASLFEVEESKLKETMKGDFSTLDNKNKIKISIYTAGRKNDIIGYDVEYNNKIILSYYTNNGDFELVIDNSDDGESNGIEVTDKIESKTIISGEKNGDKTNVTIKYNDKTLATLVVSQWDDKKKAFSYKIDLDGDSITGDFDLNNTSSGKNKKFSIKLSAKSGSDEISLDINFGIDFDAKIVDIDTSKAQTLSEEQLQQVANDFLQSLNDTPIGTLFSTLSSELTDYDSLEDYSDYDSSFDWDDESNYVSPLA